MSVPSAGKQSITLGALLAPAQPWQDESNGDVDYYDMAGFGRAEPRVCAASTIAADAQCVSPGDVLVSMRTQAPRRAWVIGEARGRPQVASTDWLVLRSDALDPAYARQLLVSNEFELACAAHVPKRRGGHSPDADLAAITLSLPAKPMQAAAARVMDCADTLRGRRAVVIERSRELAHALFVERFSASPPTIFPLTELSSLLSEPSCRGADVILEPHGRFPVIRAADLYEGEVSLTSPRYVSRSDTALARSALANGDLLLAREPRRADVRVAIARPGDAIWFLHAKLWRLRAGSAKVLPEYLRAWLSSSSGQRNLREVWLSAGARMPVEQRLAEIAVPLPPLEAQQQFADRLNAAERLIGRLLVSAERLDALLGTLRDLAFRGELQLA